MSKDSDILDNHNHIKKHAMSISEKKETQKEKLYMKK